MGRFARGDILSRSKVFAVRAIRFVRSLPSEPASRHIGLQCLRAATSVGANLHEADMADTVKDFISKVNVAQKEAGEVCYWLALLAEAGIVATENLRTLAAESEELRKICRQIILSTRRSAVP